MVRRKKKQRAEVLANYDKVKTATFSFSSIKRYFLDSDKASIHQTISDKTYHDLDMDELFMFIDRTVSKVGQQYYYYVLRTIPRNKERCTRFEDLIVLFREDTALKESVLFQLARLSRREAYRITSLIHDKYIQEPGWFWVIRTLSLVSVGCVLLSFWYPQLLILLIVIFATNVIIHLWNKENIFRYSEAIPQLVVLNQVAQELLKLRVFSESKHEVKGAIQSINSIGRRLSVFAWEEKLQSDIGAIIDYAVELIKTLFLIEPLLLFNVLATLDSKREQLDRIYQLVGEIDTAISIYSLRKELAYYTVPTLIEKKKHLSGTEIYHPLLENFVANTVELHEKSALLSGSNMSGKTTFIRTVGINVILGQTINTCFAQEFTMPRLKVYSAVRITDDMMSEKSYYFEEVLTIKDLLEESRSGDQNLFLLDELFKGTNTVERIAAGKSVLTYLNSKDNIVLIATHDLELSEYLSSTYDLYHFTELVKNNTISFDYKIKAGSLTTTNAIRILELNDYPDEVVTEARQLIARIEHLNKKPRHD